MEIVFAVIVSVLLTLAIIHQIFKIKNDFQTELLLRQSLELLKHNTKSLNITNSIFTSMQESGMIEISGDEEDERKIGL